MSVERAVLGTIEEATAYLEGLINRERQTDYAYQRLDLEPIRALLDGMGRPQEGLSIIHVAGSKGKGSTCLFAEAILRELGERVGTFTSPHLVSWVERFRVDGIPIDEERLVHTVERVRPVVEALLEGPVETKPSFFDATTAVALAIFADAGVDRVLLEVGLGGRLDSTNIVDPQVTCVTSIELEHTDKLGLTEAAIAGEKVGIAKPGVPLVVGALRDEAMQVVRDRAEAIGAPTTVLGVDFDVRPPERASASEDEGRPPGEVGQRLRFEMRDGFELEAPLATPGRVARTNAALAIACVRALQAHDDRSIAAAAASALSTCQLPGRTEVLTADPRVIIDAAHTTESSLALAESLAELAPSGFDLLLSVSADKQLDSLLEPLLAGVSRVVVTRAEPIRSLAADELAKRVRETALARGLEVDVLAIDDPEEAARHARGGLEAGRMLCAAGSVYLAGVARRVLSGDAGEIDRPDESGRAT